MNEIWKDIPGYEGIYEASSLGRIRSKDGKTTHSDKHGVRKWKSKIIKPKACPDQSLIGYRVTLWKDKRPHDYLVARLVCATFIENLLDTKMTVNHKDGDRLNNRVENLEWLTRADNIRHAFTSGLQSSQKGVTLKNEDSILIFRSMAKASEFLGYNNGYLSGQIKRGGSITDKTGRKYEVI